MLILVEVFFDPQAHLSRGVPFDVLFSGFQAARTRAAKELGISSELICCFLRHLPVQDSLTTFQLEGLQDSFKRGDIIGIGLDSSELGYPPELFTDIYVQAKALSIKRTAHAGEEGPSSYIRGALDALDVDRIDHGIRLAEDPQLLKQIAKQGMMLSFCPISNVLLRCVSSVAELPIRKFLDAGIKFSINSDDPAYFGNHYILDNYCAVQEAFELSTTEWVTICETSIRGSWCCDQRKSELLSRLDSVVEKWEQDN